MQPEVLAAIDLGSNSFHLILAEVHADGLRWQEALSEKVQLAAGLSEDRLLDRRTQERGLACIARFAERVATVPHGNLRVVGTSTLREARNAGDFVRRAEKLLGCPVTVLTGREEARLIDLGVAHSLANQQDQRLVVDIGGGSTEMVIGRALDVKLAESLFMGCVVYTRRHFADGQVNARNLEAAKQQANALLMPVVQGFRQLGWQQAFGSSGTMKAVALACGGGNDDTGEMTITRTGLAQLRERLIAQGSLENLAVKGVAPDRCRILPAGVAILEAVMDALSLERLTYANAALREGVIHDELARRGRSLEYRAGIDMLMERCRVDRQQAERVCATVEYFYARLGQPDLSPTHHRLLMLAAELHEVGLAISREQYDKHGAYLLQHMDLPGISVQEGKRVAQLIRAQRRRIPAVLLLEQNARWLDMALLLRLAVCLHHTRRALDPAEVHLERRGVRHWHVSLPAGWREKRPLLLADLKENQAWLRKVDLGLSYDFEGR